MVFYNKEKSIESGITDLIPQEQMDPYKPCWCGSGKKWKWCHKDREKQRRPVFEELHLKMMQEAKKGTCMHPEAPSGCSGRAIKAHTVQKNGGLSGISENQHVLSVKDAYHGLTNNGSKLVPLSVGVNNASTFMGFCAFHDTALFRVAENNLDILTDEAAFVLAYRTMSYEYFAKKAAERWADIQRLADCGQPFERQVEIQMTFDWVLQGTRLAIQDFNVLKDRFDKAWAAGDYSDFHYYAVEFDTVLPIVGCGGFAPEFDFDGAVRQHLGKPDLEHLLFNWTVINNKSVAIMGWLGALPGHNKTFVESFKNIDDAEKADGLIRLVFEYVENIYFRPSWWQALKDDTKSRLNLKMRNGTLSGERTAQGLMRDDLSIFPAVNVSAVYEKLDG